MSPLAAEHQPPVTARAASAPHRRFRPIPAERPRPPRFPALHPGEPETCRRDLRQFLPIWIHLALLLAVMKVYRVEGRALLPARPRWPLVALPVHYLLAYRWKKPFFLALSVARPVRRLRGRRPA